MKLPEELPSVEEALKILVAAMKALETPDLSKTEVLRLRKHHSSNQRLPGESCGLIVYCYPPPACYGRRLVLPRMTMQEMNRQLSTINRVVIHPKYRTVGLGAR